jgi:hypothetical protein
MLGAGRKIFISYRRQDTAASALPISIGQYLAREFGSRNVFIDVDMRSGTKFSEMLEKRLYRHSGPRRRYRTPQEGGLTRRNSRPNRSSGRCGEHRRLSQRNGRACSGYPWNPKPNGTTASMADCKRRGRRCDCHRAGPVASIADPKSHPRRATDRGRTGAETKGHIQRMRQLPRDGGSAGRELHHGCSERREGTLR